MTITFQGKYVTTMVTLPNQQLLQECKEAIEIHKNNLFYYKHSNHLHFNPVYFCKSDNDAHFLTDICLKLLDKQTP